MLKVEVFDVIVVCNNVPPVAADHHLNVPDEPLVDVRATVPVPHLEAPVAEGAAGAVPEFRVATTARRALVHPPLLNAA